MLNTLLFIHLMVAVLLVVVILLQKTSTDGLSGIGGGNNMGIMSGRSAASFLTKTTVTLAAIFFVNAILLANLSTQKYTDIAVKLEKLQDSQDPAAPPQAEIPIAR